MALEKSISLQNYGIELPNSYHKIDSIRIEGGRVEFVIKVFASKEARDSNAQPLEYNSDSVDYDELNRLEGDDFIAKLYTYVKLTNPNYATATLDV
jgi:hypothetical protein